MKSLILLPLFCLPFLSTGPEVSPPKRVTCKVDPVHSSVVFRVRHSGVAWFYGMFNGIAGEFTLDPEKAEGGSVAITIDAGSVDTRAERRDTHLRGPDFFDAKQFPEITFESSAITAKGDDAFEVKGELQMRGVKKPLTLTAVKTGENEGGRGTLVGYETTFTIKRSDYGVSYGLQGGMLGDEVQVTISIEASVQGD